MGISLGKGVKTFGRDAIKNKIIIILKNGGAGGGMHLHWYRPEVCLFGAEAEPPGSDGICLYLMLLGLHRHRSLVSLPRAARWPLRRGQGLKRFVAVHLKLLLFWTTSPCVI